LTFASSQIWMIWKSEIFQFLFFFWSRFLLPKFEWFENQRFPIPIFFWKSLRFFPKHPFHGSYPLMVCKFSCFTLWVTETINGFFFYFPTHLLGLHLKSHN
jgi:hypothetical protein